MVSSDAEVLAIATSLKDSRDVNSKTAFLTKDFIDGKSTKVSATKLRVMFGVPYNVPTYDEAFILT